MQGLNPRGPTFGHNRVKDGDLHSSRAGDLAVPKPKVQHHTEHKEMKHDPVVEELMRNQVEVKDISTPHQSKAEKMLASLKGYLSERNITWGFQTSRGDGVIRDRHSLSHTDFGKWSLSDNKHGLPEGGTCSCYEVILKAGVENGLIDHKQLNALYQADTQSSCKWMDEDLCKEKTVLTSPNPDPQQERPKAGDLILFGDNTRDTDAEQRPSTNVHVVTALGNEDGVVRVLSHHREGQPPVVLTLEELMEEMPRLSGQEMVFSEPQWPM